MHLSHGDSVAAEAGRSRHCTQTSSPEDARLTLSRRGSPGGPGWTIKPWGLCSGVSTSGRPPCPCDSGDGKVAQHRDWEISAGRLYGSRRPSSARRCTSQCPLALDALTRSSSLSRSASGTPSPLPWELSIKRKEKNASHCRPTFHKRESSHIIEYVTSF